MAVVETLRRKEESMFYILFDAARLGFSVLYTFRWTLTTALALTDSHSVAQPRFEGRVAFCSLPSLLHLIITL